MKKKKNILQDTIYKKNIKKKNHICDPKFLEKRSDDNEETVVNRFENYLNKSLPILDFYKDLDLLHQINGMGEISVIFEQIRSIIASLET